jgi:hypothetical protein
MRRTIGVGAAVLATVVVVVAIWLGLAPPLGQPTALLNPWGPLAVIPPQDGADSARTEGTLRITEECVHVEWRGELTFLFWPADRTLWDAASRAITFRNFDGTFATVSDGDTVVLGGGGDSAAESGLTGEQWVSSMRWVAPPAASCSLDQRWAVGAVEG